MEALRAFNHVLNPFNTKSLPFQCHCVWNKNTKIRCKVNVKPNSVTSDDPLLEAAIYAATLRFQETHRPEPLFHDPYVACLVPPNTSTNYTEKTHPYCMNTRFIDDKLLQILRHTDDLKQVVLLTDGADTRAYRLSWPISTLIFDVSAGRIYSDLSQKLQDVGAQITKNSVLFHVPMESPNLPEALRKRGINGNRPSIWVLQGLPLMTLAGLKDVLSTISTLAMKGCMLIGEVPACLIETERELEVISLSWHYSYCLVFFLKKLPFWKDHILSYFSLQNSREEGIHKVFMSHGFQVQVIDYENLAVCLGVKLSGDKLNSILFLAEHLRFSDDQMETWRREFHRAEEDCDEDGFEDL